MFQSALQAELQISILPELASPVSQIQSPGTFFIRNLYRRYKRLAQLKIVPN